MAKGKERKAYMPSITARDMKTMYVNKYYNLWMNMFEWNGLTREEQTYIMKKLWSEGTIAAFRIPLLNGELGYAPYAEFGWNMYDFPEEVTLINERGVPYIPMNVQTVDEDVVLGWAQYNKKPVRMIVDYYIDRMVQVDMVINTNIELHKMPFLIACAPEDADKLKDIVQRILNNELVVYADADQVNLIKSLATQPQYVIDKLHAYRIQLENELLTYLGFDNSGNSEKATTMLLDEINANNVMINVGGDQFESCLGDWCKRIGEVFGKTISCKLKAEKAEESLESRNRSDAEAESGFVRQGERTNEND